MFLESLLIWPRLVVVQGGRGDLPENIMEERGGIQSCDKLVRSTEQMGSGVHCSEPTMLLFYMRSAPLEGLHLLEGSSLAVALIPKLLTPPLPQRSEDNDISIWSHGGFLCAVHVLILLTKHTALLIKFLQLAFMLEFWKLVKGTLSLIHI